MAFTLNALSSEQLKKIRETAEVFFSKVFLYRRNVEERPSESSISLGFFTNADNYSCMFFSSLSNIAFFPPKKEESEEKITFKFFSVLLFYDQCQIYTLAPHSVSQSVSQLTLDGGERQSKASTKIEQESAFLSFLSSPLFLLASSVFRFLCVQLWVLSKMSSLTTETDFSLVCFSFFPFFFFLFSFPFKLRQAMVVMKELYVDLEVA